MKMMTKLTAMACGALLMAGAAFGQATHVTISQVYGAGGNAGATYNADFVELFNPTGAAVDMSGWSLQYMSAAGNFSTGSKITFASGTSIASHSYFLIRCGAPGTNGVGLPTPDIAGTTIAAAAGAGKFALCSDATTLSGTCPTGGSIVDFVGYGTTANCFEGSGPTPAPSATLAVFRASDGCTDSDRNSVDFTALAVNPRNSGSPTNSCSPSTPPTGMGIANPVSACPGTMVTFTVTSTPGTNPTSPVTSVTGDFTSFGLSNAEVFVQGPAGIWTYSLTLGNPSLQTYNIPIAITDAIPRTGNATISLPVGTCSPRITTGTAASPSGICDGTNTTFTVNLLAGQNPTSTAFTVTADLTPIGGPAMVTFTQVGTTFSYTYTAASNPTTAGAHVLNFTADDGNGRPVNGTFNIVTSPCTNSSSTVVISQVYGGGGNTGATLTNDFVELYNRSNAAVDVTGWSVQYASATDSNGGFGSANPATNVPVVLTGTIPAGRYFLVQMAAGAGGTQALPTPDATGNIAMNASSARVALVDNSTALLTDCASTHIRDLVGYGEGTGAPICFEGDNNIGPTQTLDNPIAAIRNQNGCQDSDRNRVDFSTGTPHPRNSASPINLCGVGPPTGVCCRGSTCTTSIGSGPACAATLISGQAAGSTFISSASTCNTGAVSNGPCCYANYNHNATVEVQDIFDFLADWFAGSPYANTGGTGVSGTLSVQNIFDFLADWFAGGCV